MSLKIHGLKNCDTCRKAVKHAEARGLHAIFRDVRHEPFTREEITHWLSFVGREVLLNTRSTTWRNLEEEARVVDSEEKLVKLLIENPALLKRPLIEFKNRVIVGWGKAQQAEFEGLCLEIN